MRWFYIEYRCETTTELYRFDTVAASRNDALRSLLETVGSYVSILNIHKGGSK